MARMLRLNAVPENFGIEGLREMQDGDIKAVVELYENYMKRFNMAPVMSEEEMRHHMLSGKGTGEPKNGRRKAQVVWAYVVEVRRSVPLVLRHALTDSPEEPRDKGHHRLLLLLLASVDYHAEHETRDRRCCIFVLLRNR